MQILIFLLQLCRLSYWNQYLFFFARAAASKNGQGGPSGDKKIQKKKLNGSEKRKRKNAKKNGGNEVDKAKKHDSSMSVCMCCLHWTVSCVVTFASRFMLLLWSCVVSQTRLYVLFAPLF